MSTEERLLVSNSEWGQIFDMLEIANYGPESIDRDIASMLCDLIAKRISDARRDLLMFKHGLLDGNFMLVEMFGGPEIISENPEIYATPDDVLNSMEWWSVYYWNKARDDGDFEGGIQPTLPPEEWIRMKASELYGDDVAYSELEFEPWDLQKLAD